MGEGKDKGGIVNLLLEGHLWNMPSPFIEGVLSFLAPEAAVESEEMPDDPFAFQRSVANIEAKIREMNYNG